MLCKVSTPASPNGSSWKRPCASDWSKVETTRLNSSCSKKDDENIIIELQRGLNHEECGKTHQDHIADRGHVFHVALQHCAHTDSHTESSDNSNCKSCNGQRLEQVENETITFKWHVH